jgi:DHA2 family multidrug resistance protein
LATLAFVGYAGVFLMRSHYTTDVDQWTLVLPTLLQGIPTALFFVPLTAIILSGLPAEKIPAAAGVSNFARVFAGAAGTSLVTTGWNDRTILHHAQLAEQSSVDNPAYRAAIANVHAVLGGSTDQAVAFFERSLNAQAAMLGLNDIFWLSAGIFVVIIPLIWLTRPAKGGGGAAAAGAH